jgi:hypothetical protein
MNNLKLEEKNLLKLIVNKLKNRTINFKKRNDVIKTYDRLHKIILAEGYSAYDINLLLSSKHKLKIIDFLKVLSLEYNKILYNNLCQYDFKNDIKLKEFCTRSKIRGFRKVKDKLLEIANKNIHNWDGFWSFSDYKKGKINNIKLIDPDIIKNLDI